MISLIHYLWNVWEVSKNYDYYINMLMRQLPCILFISSIVWSNHGSRTTDWSKCLFLKRKYATYRLGCAATWEEAVIEYKSYWKEVKAADEDKT